MYARKFAFSLFTLPAVAYVSQAAEFQKRRRLEKEHESSRRAELLAHEPVDITPKNGGSFPWSGKDADKFENEWSFKPVTLRGHLDFDRQIKIARTVNGEKGYDIVTPFVTHLNKNDEPCGIAVNRGWVPMDLADYRYDRRVDTTQVQGVLYRGDAKTKYSKHNTPAHDNYHNAYPEELSVIFQFANEAEASQFMVKAVDFDVDNRTPMPDVPSKEEIT